jgi:hypothetical protein
MKREVANEIRRLGEDPADETWRWLSSTGPHGPSFTWGQTRKESTGYVGVSHLQEIVREHCAADSTFLERTIRVANIAMASELPELVRRGLQVAAVVGGESELLRVQLLAASLDKDVAADARASAFHLKHRRSAA